MSTPLLAMAGRALALANATCCEVRDASRVVAMAALVRIGIATAGERPVL